MNYCSKCEAPERGESIYCDRHQCHKTYTLWKKCQQQGIFWEKWEQGIGPGQNGKSEAIVPTKTDGRGGRCKKKRDSNLLSKEIARVRNSVCEECPSYMGDGRCKHIELDLDCKSTYQSWLSDGAKECPEGRWNKIEEAYSGITRQRQRTCYKCEHYRDGRCVLLGAAHSRALMISEPICPKNKWIARWKPVNDPFPEKTSDLLVITVAVGEMFHELLELTGPAIKRYAEKCGADYAQLTSKTQNWWGLEKFRIYRFAQRYKRTLFIDADVLLISKSPNLFDVVPEGHVAMHDDYPHLAWKPWMHYERGILAKSQGVEIPDPDQAWNTGIVMCDQDQADVWRPPYHPFEPAHCCEQLWVEYQAMKYPFFELDSELNCQYWMNDYYLRLPTAKIIHLSNCSHENRMLSTRQYLTW